MRKHGRRQKNGKGRRTLGADMWLATAYWQLNHLHDAEDTVQEARLLGLKRGRAVAEEMAQEGPLFGTVVRYKAIDKVRAKMSQCAALLEIASGNPTTNHYGTGFSLSAEQMWDELLSANMRIFAVAVDDAHLFRGEFSIGRPFPGRAWVVVRAATLTRESILAALEDGEFYASTGVTLRDIRSTSESLAVDIQPDEGGYPRRFRVVFIGENGRVLAATQNNPARYAFVGDEGYVRARIEDSRGLRAWTQPVFVESRP